MVEEFKPEINGEGLRIGIVKARFNETVGEGLLLNACVAELMAKGVAEEDILYITVPGALKCATGFANACAIRRI